MEFVFKVLISSNKRTMFRDSIEKRVRTSHIMIHTSFRKARYIFGNLYDETCHFSFGLTIYIYIYIYIIEIQTAGRFEFH